MDDRYVRFAEVTAWLDDILGRSFYPEVAKLGLARGQPKILRFLDSHDGCCQQEIAAHFFLKAASVSASLDKLAAAGLIDRRPNPRSRRETLIFLTDLGREKTRQLLPLYEQLSRQSFKYLSQEEYELLLDMLQRIIRAGEEELS